MKKCASCTKDLPDAALHCVFCGAKQPPAPAVAAGQAKTVMGYSANEVAEHLKQQGHSPRAHAPSAPPFQPPRPAPPAGGQFPAPAPSYPSAPPQYQPPSAAANAATMFVPGGGPPGAGQFPNQPGPSGPTAGAFAIGGGPAPAHQPQPQPATTPYQAPNRANRPSQQGGMGGMAPAPIQPLPQYQATHSTPARAGRPLEPWKDALRIMMFIWGGVLIVAFLTPTGLVPDLKFHFNTIIDGTGSQKIEPLVLVAVGLLSIVLGAIPMSSLPRGLIAGLMGLTGLLLPTILDLVDGKDLQWQQLVGMVGMIVLIPSLLLRHEYRESILPRVMITVGVLMILVPELVPQHEQIHLVDNFKAVIDAEGDKKIMPIIEIVKVLLVVATLLAWLPSPSSGASKLFAWLLIPYGALVTLTLLILALGSDKLGAILELSPYGAVMAWAPVAAFLVLVGYGFATVLGKQLE